MVLFAVARRTSEHGRMPSKTSPGRVSWEQRWLADPVSAIQMTCAPSLHGMAGAVKSAPPGNFEPSSLMGAPPSSAASDASDQPPTVLEVV